jgi:RNA polymerase sigma-70 factor (ECF subfamily)
MDSSITFTLTAAEREAAMAYSARLPQCMDEAAFHDLYTETAARLRAYIRRAAREGALADDIFQETYLRFLRANVAHLDPRQMKAYLYKTATSLLMDHWRREKRHRRWSLLTMFREHAPPPDELSDDMGRLFQQLKPREQALLWMAYVEGFDHREIGAALQLGERSVRVLLFRARKKLAGILTEQGLGPEGAL